VLPGGTREVRSRPPRSWITKAGAWLDRAAFKPASLPDDLVTLIALAPPIIAGLVIFRSVAAEMLAIAAVTGLIGVAVAHWLWRHQMPHPGAGPLIAALFGVALVGTGASFATTAEVATLAVVLEVLRGRFLPAVRAQAGLLAWAMVALVTRGAVSAYVNPANGQTFDDPIGLWYQFFSPGAAAVDPIKLYVGNVAGPAFATSLLAVAIGVAWLAYARRVSLVVLFGFFVGAVLAINTFHWDALFQLDSGPTWFVAGLILADRRLLPDSWAVRPTLGFAAGLFAVGLRRPAPGAWFGAHGLEVAFITIAVIQAVMAIIVVVYWSAAMGMERLRRERRLRQREANLRAVKTISRAS